MISKSTIYRVQTVIVRIALGFAKPFPLSWRVVAAGKLCAALIVFVPSLRTRGEKNLTHVYPEMSKREKRRIIRGVASTIGQTLTEILFNQDYEHQAREFTLSGPGVAALKTARAEGKGAIIVSGHFGQWEAIRHALKAQGLETGAIYRPNNNPYFEPLFRAGIDHGGQPIIAKGYRGNRQMLRHIRSGGFIALLPDQHFNDGTRLHFLGQAAVTTLSPAQLALRYNLPLVPCFGLRKNGGVEITCETPISASQPIEMMQEFNHRLGAWVRRYPEQWLWFHRRWRVIS